MALEVVQCTICISLSKTAPNPNRARGLHSIQGTDSLWKDGVRFFSEVDHKPLSVSYFFYSTPNNQVREGRDEDVCVQGRLSYFYAHAHLPPVTKAPK